MKESDLKVFLNGVIHYYTQITGSDVNVKAPYLIEDVKEQLSDYTGRIKISGEYQGEVLFTAPHLMLVTLLARYGQKETNSHYLLDLVGEIANTISGNAREVLGNKFELSPPSVMRGNSIVIQNIPGLKTYCIPINWERHQAKLIVAVA